MQNGNNKNGFSLEFTKISGEHPKSFVASLHNPHTQVFTSVAQLAERLHRKQITQNVSSAPIKQMREGSNPFTGSKLQGDALNHE